MKKKHLALKIIAIILVIVLAGAGTTIGILASIQKKHISSSNEMLSKETTTYYTDESGKHIANIPYDEYISGCKEPKKYTVVEGLKPYIHYYDNTELIQAAIDKISENKNGGVVYIPEGEYYITSLTLKENVTLFISENCTLYATEKAAYNPVDNGYEAVFSAKSAEDFSVTGGGTIIVNGDSYINEDEDFTPLYALKTFNLYTRVAEAEKRKIKADENTPYLFNLKSCYNFSVSNIRIVGSANRTFNFDKCHDITIKNIVIDNNFYIDGNDGIVFNGAENIKISHSFIVTGGDGICFRSSLKKVVDVEISDCVICSFGNCFKIGDRTNYNVQNIKLTDCSFFIPDGLVGGYTGIALESCDGSKLSNITIKNISMDGISSPLLIWLGDRLNSKKKEVGSIHDISISGINATNIEMPCVISGCKDKKAYNITLSDIDLSYRDTGENLDIKNPTVTKCMSKDPEIINVSSKESKKIENSKYYSLPAYGLFIRYAENITATNFKCIGRSGTELEMYFTEESNECNLK